jgi:predicted permease
MTTTSYVTYDTIRTQVSSLSGVAAWQRASTGVLIGSDQVHATAMLISGNYFDVLGAAARIGRVIGPADDRSADAVAVLSQTFWQTALNGDRAVLGRPLSVGGLEYQIVGVMPEGFSGHSNMNVDVWVPVAAAMRFTPGWNDNPFQNIVSVVARLEPGRTPLAVSAQIRATLDRQVSLAPVRGAEVGADERRLIYWLTALSSVVFAIGIANAATLLLVWGSRRRREVAIRAALGATRWRLHVQAFVESVVVSSVAGSVSLLLSWWFQSAIRPLLLPNLLEGTPTMGVTIVAATIAAAVSAIATGCTSSLQLSAQPSAGILIGSERFSSRRARLQTGLLVLQTALCVMLLTGAAMFGRSLHNLIGQDFGMRMNGVLIVDFDKGPGPVPGQDAIYVSAVEQVRSIPGVQSASVISQIPFTGFNVPPIAVPGRAEPPNVGGQLPYLIASTPQLLDILGVRIVQGRAFTADDERGAPVVIVNQSMANAVWPNETALGKCIRIGFDPTFDPMTATGPPVPSAAVACREVVGVAHDIRQRSVLPTGSEDRLMQYFVPFSQIPAPPAGVPPGPRTYGLLLRASASAAGLAPAIRQAVMGGRRDLPFVRIREYSDLLDRQIRPWKLATALLELFGVLALGVGGIGLYAAFAHAVALRRREMAIRIAIGARGGRVMGVIVGEALVLACAGIVVGWLSAVAGGHWLQSMFFGTSPTDPLVLGSTALLMLTVAAAATVVPAYMAARANPSELLRTE